MKIISKNKIKIVLVLFFTFFTVKTVAPNLFIADSPMINQVFITEILNKPKEIALMPEKFLSSLANFRLFNDKKNITDDSRAIADVEYTTPPPDAIFEYVSKGVSAAEDTNTGEKYIKVEAGTKYRVVGTITINGVQYPKIEFLE